MMLKKLIFDRLASARHFVWRVLIVRVKPCRSKECTHSHETLNPAVAAVWSRYEDISWLHRLSLRAEHGLKDQAADSGKDGSTDLATIALQDLEDEKVMIEQRVSFVGGMENTTFLTFKSNCRQTAVMIEHINIAFPIDLLKGCDMATSLYT